MRRLEDELRILTEIRRNFDAEKRDLETKLHDTEATCRAMQAANQDLDQYVLYYCHFCLSDYWLHHIGHFTVLYQDFLLTPLPRRLHQSIDMARQQEENLSRAELNSTRLNGGWRLWPYAGGLIGRGAIEAWA